jgi:chitin disaccharide deacetylase
MSSPIHLCIMSDDFGMHPAVNDGIAQAFTEGLLTDANLMAPCQAFKGAAALARDLRLPVGFHATLTCDWDRYFWGPLTHAPSLVTPEGNFKHLVSLAWSAAKDEEVLAELTAQVQAIEAEGLHITHSSYHMGTDGHGRLMRLLGQIGFERVGPLRLVHAVSASDPEAAPVEAYIWNSAFFSSDWELDYAARKARLVGKLKVMEPGYHLWMVHAAIDHPSMDELCSPSFFAWDWARPFRALDQRLLLDPEIKDLIAELGIQRIPVEQAPHQLVHTKGPEME